MCSWMAGYLASGDLTARQAKYIISHISLSKNIPLTWAMWARPLSICTLIHNVHCFQLQSSIISDMGLLSKWLFWGAFYAFIWQASSRGDRKGERGDDMQPLAEGGIKPQVAAKDSAFSVHGVPALPSELKGAPIWELFQRYIPSFNVGLGQLFVCPDFKMRITGVWIFFFLCLQWALVGLGSLTLYWTVVKHFSEKTQIYLHICTQALLE